MNTSDLTLPEKMVLAGRILDGLGLTEGFGHVTARQPDDPGTILCTGAKAPGLASLEDLLEFTLAGECVRAAASGLRPALETPMHLAIYRARPDVMAICRTHSPYAVVCGVAETPIRANHGFGGMLGRKVPVHPETDLIVDAAMGDAVAASLGSATALLIRGNGALAAGPTLERAVVHAIYLEESARNQVLGLPLGGARRLSKAELAARSRWYDNEAVRAWDYYAAKFGGALPANPGPS
jgi:HCOMODA/2-hydroxy-3-carboxy-muconic semialdehyde decarboxylase